MHKVLQSKDDMNRKQGRRGLASFDNCVDAAIQKLEEYRNRNIKYSNP